MLNTECWGGGGRRFEATKESIRGHAACWSKECECRPEKKLLAGRGGSAGGGASRQC